MCDNSFVTQLRARARPRDARGRQLFRHVDFAKLSCIGAGMARREDVRANSNYEASTRETSGDFAMNQGRERSSRDIGDGQGGQLVRHRIVHVRQCYNWDCGLACVLMVVEALGVSSDFLTLNELCPITSIWTIDLAYLLRKFGAEVTFCTVTLGANPQFETEKFYQDNMAEDSQRIAMLFRDAADNGISVQRRSLSLDDMRRYMLSGECIMVVLVDKKKFMCHAAHGDPYAHLLAELGDSYTGHYVVVSGFDPGSGNFVVHDPAAAAPALEIPGAALEVARKAFGTDEDLLIVESRRLDPARVEEAVRDQRRRAAEAGWRAGGQQQDGAVAGGLLQQQGLGRAGGIFDRR